jgi:hypothetical protein
LVEPFANNPFVIAVQRDAVAERVGAGIPHVLEQFPRADRGAVGSPHDHPTPRKA